MAKSKSRFAGKVSKTSQKEAHEGSSYGHLRIPRGVNIFKESKRCTFDILPYKVTEENHPDRDDAEGIAQVGDLWYRRPYKLHRNIGPNNDAIVCLDSFGKTCPICKHRKKRLREGAGDEELRQTKTSDRCLYLVLPFSKDFDEKPHLWDISKFGFQEMLNQEIEENPDYECFPDPDQGLTIQARFTEETFKKNTFNKISRIDFLDRDYSYPEKFIDGLPLLDECLEELPYEKIEAMLLGDDDAPAATEDDRPRRRRARDDDDEDEGQKPSRRRSQDDDEDDKPQRRRAKEDDEDAKPSRRRAQDEDEDAKPSRRRNQDEDEDKPQRRKPKDEDEDAKPSRRRAQDDDEGDKPQRRKPKDDEGDEDKPQRRRTAAPDPDEDDKPQRRKPKDEDEDAKPSRKTEKPAGKAGKGGDRCPHGGTFGASCETMDVCDSCNLWSDCIDEKENG